MVRHVTLGAAALLALALVACGRTSPLEDTDVLTLRILPATLDLYLLETVQLTVEARFADGTLRDVAGDDELSYRVNQSGVILMQDGGRLFAKEAGDVRLWAYYRGREAHADVSVAYSLLQGLSVDPSAFDLLAGENQQLAVRGSLSDGSTLDLYSGATGTTYDPEDRGVVAVTTDGLVFALAAGQTAITVRHGGFEAQAVATVEEGGNPLVKLEASPTHPELKPGGSKQLTVTGTYEDGSSADLTADSRTRYSSSDPAVATVSAQGLVTGVAIGDAVVTVSHLTLVTTVMVKVFADPGTATMTGVELTPETMTLRVGETLQFSLMALFSDGSKRDYTEAEYGSTYKSSDFAVLGVDMSGYAWAIAPGGPVTVTAKNRGFTDTASVLVTP
jgi:uncharacterized protein YjdB